MALTILASPRNAIHDRFWETMVIWIDAKKALIRLSADEGEINLRSCGKLELEADAETGNPRVQDFVQQSVRRVGNPRVRINIVVPEVSVVRTIDDQFIQGVENVCHEV
jgi:hypothetical protein